MWPITEPTEEILYDTKMADINFQIFTVTHFQNKP